MKKDKRFEKMNNMPNEITANFRPSIVSENQSTEAAKDKQNEASKTTASLNGNLGIRIPKSLHVQLHKEAEDEGVSLEEYIIYKLTQHKQPN